MLRLGGVYDTSIYNRGTECRVPCVGTLDYSLDYSRVKLRLYR